MAYQVPLHILGKQSPHQLLRSVFTYNRGEAGCEFACWYQIPAVLFDGCVLQAVAMKPHTNMKTMEYQGVKS
jgi:hypothetical protein